MRKWMHVLYGVAIAVVLATVFFLSYGCSVVNPICMVGCQNNSNNQNQTCVTCPSMGKASGATVYK